MSEVIITAVLAPLMREPNPRAELVSQLPGGETARVLEERGGWLQVERRADGYHGWVNRGYGRVVEESAAAEWRERARFMARDAELANGDGRRVRVPLLARLAREGGEFELASGRRGRVSTGAVEEVDQVRREALTGRPLDWARHHFHGSPYLWGGITPWGVDCSGLVQTTFAVRGVAMPRDARDQASIGMPVASDAILPGDLLFFSEAEGRITHVAFAGDHDSLVHSTLACGGFVEEPWGPGSRAHVLREQLVAIRRL